MINNGKKNNNGSLDTPKMGIKYLIPDSFTTECERGRIYYLIPSTDISKTKLFIRSIFGAVI